MGSLRSRLHKHQNRLMAKTHSTITFNMRFILSIVNFGLVMRLVMIMLPKLKLDQYSWCHYTWNGYGSQKPWKNMLIPITVFIWNYGRKKRFSQAMFHNLVLLYLEDVFKTLISRWIVVFYLLFLYHILLIGLLPNKNSLCMLTKYKQY